MGLDQNRRFDSITRHGDTALAAQLFTHFTVLFYYNIGNKAPQSQAKTGHFAITIQLRINCRQAVSGNQVLA